jgi:flavin-dependent dehydrogenase
MKKNFDAIVIGSGQSGPFLAVRMAAAGKRVAAWDFSILVKPPLLPMVRDVGRLKSCGTSPVGKQVRLAFATRSSGRPQ